MSGSAIIFYLISAFILGAGILAVTTRKIFRAAIWLLCSLVGIAALYFWMEVEFIAAVQVVVYVGGIVVLIIFSIFLTQQSGMEMPRPVRSRKIFSTLAVCSGFLLTCVQLVQYSRFQATEPRYDMTEPDMSVSAIGSQLLSTTEHGY